MERMPACRTDREDEMPGSEYCPYKHFITNSKWDHGQVLAKVSADTSELMRSNKKRAKGQPDVLLMNQHIAIFS